MSAARKHTRYGRCAAQEVPVSTFIPYTRHLDDTTLRTKEGDLLQIIRVSGLSFETADQAELNMRKEVRATLLRGIANPRIGLYYHIIRREEQNYPGGDFSSIWCAALDAAYQDRLHTKRMFVNEQYITVLYRPKRDAGGLLSTLLGRIDQESVAQTGQEQLRALQKTTDTLLSQLAPYGAELLSVYETEEGVFSEPLSFLSYLLNQEKAKLRLPRMDISAYLPSKRIFFGKEAFEIRGARTEDVKLGAMLSLKEYCNHTAAGMLDGLLRLPHEFIVTQSFEFVPREPVLRTMRRIRRQLESTEQGAHTLEADVTEGIDSAASGIHVFGNHHLTVTVTGKSENALNQAVSRIVTEFVNGGNVVVREDVNMEAAYWAQMPGNFHLIARKSLITNQNFAGFASLHNFPSGKATGNHWGDAICLLETTSGTPYFFNFHKADVGNFTIIGPTGTGKTVLMEFLLAQAMRHHPRTVYFDKDRGAEIFLRAVGGDYTIVQPGIPTGLNPLQLPDSPENRAFLREWIRTLALAGSDTPLSLEDEEIIAEAVDQNFTVGQEYRSLRHLAAVFGGYTRNNQTSLEKRLRKWHGDGERAWLFDNPVDTLSLGNPTLGFDLTSILDDPISRTPWLMYVFHRVAQMMTGEKVIIMLDEGWKMLDDPVFAARIKDWEKTIRKQNGILGFATQSAKDALESSIGHAIIEQSPTQIFLPNARAEAKDYCGGFGLSEQEFALVKGLAPESRCFLLRHGTDSVVARLDLSGMDDFLAVLSGRTDTVALLDSIRAECGDEVQQWYETFHQRRKDAA